MKRDYIHAARFNRGEIVGQTQSLTRRLAWEREAREFGVFYFIINDQIVSQRLTVKVTINCLRNKQLFALTAVLQLFINGAHMFSDEGPVFFRRFPTLLELPLAFE